MRQIIILLAICAGVYSAQNESELPVDLTSAISDNPGRLEQQIAKPAASADGGDFAMRSDSGDFAVRSDSGDFAMRFFADISNLAANFNKLFAQPNCQRKELLGASWQGNKITALASKGAAAKIGLKAGDEVVYINGKSVRNYEQIAAALSKSKGKYIKLRAKRGRFSQDFVFKKEDK